MCFPSLTDNGLLMTPIPALMWLNAYFVPVSCRRAARNNEKVGGLCLGLSAGEAFSLPGARRSLEGFKKQHLLGLDYF